MAKSDSNLSTGGGNAEQAPLPQHKRFALGQSPNGQKNPNGAESGPTDKRIGNAKVTY